MARNWENIPRSGNGVREKRRSIQTKEQDVEIEHHSPVHFSKNAARGRGDIKARQ